MITRVIQVRLANDEETFINLLKNAGQKKKDIKKALPSGGLSDIQWSKDGSQPLQMMIAMLAGRFEHHIDLACLADAIKNNVFLFWAGSHYCLPVTKEDIERYANKIIDKSVAEYEKMVKQGGKYATITFDPEGGLIQLDSDRGSEWVVSSGEMDQMTSSEKSLLMFGDEVDELEIYHKYNMQHGKHASLETLRQQADAKKKAEKERMDSWGKNGFAIQMADGSIFTTSEIKVLPQGEITLKPNEVNEFNITWNVVKTYREE